MNAVDAELCSNSHVWHGAAALFSSVVSPPHLSRIEDRGGLMRRTQVQSHASLSFVLGFGYYNLLVNNKHTGLLG